MRRYKKIVKKTYIILQNYLVIKNSVVEIENTGYNDNKEINVKSTFLFLEYRIFKSKDIEA